MACASMVMLWLFIGRRRQRGPTAAGPSRLNAVQVIFLLSLLVLLALAVLMWNDRAISMPLLGSLLGSIITGLPLFRSARKEKTDLSTQGKQSPSVRSSGKVTISYGGAVSGGKKAGAGQTLTQGEQSPAVEAEKDVEIRYEK